METTINRMAGQLDQLAFPIDQLVLDPRNARRHNDRNLQTIMKSLAYYGQRTPVVVNSITKTVLKGNGLVIAARDLGWTQVAAVWVDDDEETAKAYAIMDNQSGLTSEWDLTTLKDLLQELDTGAFDMDLTGFSSDELEGMLTELGGSGAGGTGASDLSLSDRFIVPPFSVLDTRQGYWQDRKKEWLSFGIQSELGRGETVLFKSASIMSDIQTTENGHVGNLDYYRKKNARTFGQDLMKGEDPNFPSRRSADQHSNIKNSPKMPAYSDIGMEYIAAGTSIFDPVLCELSYRWFTPAGGLILDPFAGGSVRGVVAGVLGYQYIGIDLSDTQITANRQQWEDISSRIPMIEDDGMADVKISAASARQMFRPCDPDYMKNVCKTGCCFSNAKTGTMISIAKDEEARITELGGDIQDGLLQPIMAPSPRGLRLRCPFQIDDTGLCQLHGSEDKPFGCVASPFTMNATGTLIVRNRYRLLKCYRADGAVPAYQAFRSSLDRIFGQDLADDICHRLDAGEGDFKVKVPRETYQRMLYLDGVKHGITTPRDGSKNAGSVAWITGDSGDMDVLLGDQMVDMIFTCPPYYDLEVYGNDPADLSRAATYDDFRASYSQIIAKAVTHLQDDSFAVVVGDIRDKAGIYRNFVSDTIRAFLDAGMQLYNEAILVNVLGSLPIRVARQFSAGRKLGKTHQNVLVFYKGDPSHIKDRFPDVEVTKLLQGMEVDSGT